MHQHAPAPARVSPVIEPWMVPVALVKGIIMAAVILGIAEAGFLQAIAVAACSATITGVFLVVASWVQAKHTGRKVDEVAGKVETVAEAVEAAPNGH